MLRRGKFLVIHPYNFIQPDEDRASGSVIRTASAVKHRRHRDIPDDTVALWPQGFKKENPQQPLFRRLSLGENVAAYAHSLPELRDLARIVKPVSWGTLGDTLAAYKMAADRGVDIAHFYFVTDPDHMKRAKLIWEMTHPEGWTAHFFESEPVLTPKERLIREPLSRLICWRKLAKHKRYTPAELRHAQF